jgi:hypothetical protein
MLCARVTSIADATSGIDDAELSDPGKTSDSDMLTELPLTAHIYRNKNRRTAQHASLTPSVRSEYSSSIEDFHNLLSQHIYSLSRSLSVINISAFNCKVNLIFQSNNYALPG